MIAVPEKEEGVGRSLVEMTSVRGNDRMVELRISSKTIGILTAAIRAPHF